MPTQEHLVKRKLNNTHSRKAILLTMLIILLPYQKTVTGGEAVTSKITEEKLNENLAEAGNIYNCYQKILNKLTCAMDGGLPTKPPAIQNSGYIVKDTRAVFNHDKSELNFYFTLTPFDENSYGDPFVELRATCAIIANDISWLFSLDLGSLSPYLTIILPGELPDRPRVECRMNLSDRSIQTWTIFNSVPL